MKLQAPYFGNRFATVTKKKSTKVKPVSEMEALESRILLSGITAGGKVLKSYNFVDADGDKVSIKLTGKVGKGAGFQVDDLGNGFDVNEINLVGDLSKANLVVTVSPTKLAPSDRTTANQIFTPGYTNIGSITADADASLAGSTAIRNIGLNAAIVGSISIANTDVTGNITLSTGKTTFVDRINTANPVGDSANYLAGAGLIDFNDITAKSIGRITLNGVNSAPTGSFGITNDFNGTITVTNNLGSIIGIRSDINSNVIVGGTLGATGGVIVDQINGTIDTSGDLSINLGAGGFGTISADGHINLGIRGGAASGYTIIAGDGISGLSSTSKVDALKIGSNFVGILQNTSTADTSVVANNYKGIANIDVIGGTPAGFTVNSANGIGDISGTAFGGFMSVFAGSNGIGDITANGGGIGGAYISGGAIGAISSNGGQNSATYQAAGAITSFDATWLSTGPAVFTGNVTGASIGNVNITLLGIAGTAASSGSITSTAGNIGNLNFTGNVIGGLIDSAGTIGLVAVNDITGGANGDFGANMFAATGYTSTITIDGDQTGGVIEATSGNFTGLVTISGDLNGVLFADSGNLTAGLTVGNNLNGAVNIDGSIGGTILVGNNLTGFVDAETSIGAVTITNDLNGLIIAGSAGVSGGIGAIQIGGDFTAGSIAAGLGNITDFDVTGDFGAGVTAAGNIAVGQTITLGTANGGLITAGSAGTVAGSIGDISITGDDTTNAQSISVEANAVSSNGGSVGAITANGITTANTTLTVSVTNANALGNLVVANNVTGLDANLTIVNPGASITSIGAIQVDGVLELPSLASAKAITSISAASLGSVGAVTIGTAATVGSSIGLVSLGTNAVTGGGSYTFNFLRMNGQVAPGNATNAADFTSGTDITTAQAAAGGAPATSGGVTMNMI